MDRRKRYSQQKKADALAAMERNGGNCYRTAKELGIPESTLASWARIAELPRKPPKIRRPVPQIDKNAPLDEQLEQLVRQMVTVMPEKVEEASLQELARALTIVLDRMNQARSGNERVSHAREKLAEILEKYAVPESTAGADQPTDEL